MPLALQDDPYAKYGGNVAPPQQPSGDDSGMVQPIASVRAPAQPQAQQPTQTASDPYAKYGGKVAASSADSGADPYAKYNQPPMTRPQADEYLQTLAAGGTKRMKQRKPASFADTALVDPESPVFGEPIKSAIHPDTRGGRNLVPVQDVAATRQQMQYEAAHPDEMARVDQSQRLDTSLPFAERLANRAGLEARKRTELGQAVSNVNDQWKQFAGNKGADAGEAFAQFMARHFQTENPQATPGEIGVARSVGKNIASTAVDPVTHATVVTGGVGGKLGQATVAALFSAGAAKGSYDAAGQLGSIWDRPDISAQDKAEMASDLVLNTAMAGFAGSHAVRVPFIKTGDPLLSKIPQQYRDAVTQKINSTLKQTGGVLSRAASTAGDVAAEVANTDRENTPTKSASILRRALPKVPAASVERAFPIVRALADHAGFKTITAEDLLDSQPDKNGQVHSGLIGEAKKQVLAQAGRAAGEGRTIADLSPQEAQPYIQALDALDDLHDHIQQAQERETEELRKAAEKGKIPATKAAALVRMGMGMGKVSVSAAAGPALGRMSRVLLHAYGIPSGFNDLVAGVKGLIGAGGKLSPSLDETLNKAMGMTRPADIQPSTSTETRAAAQPYQGDTSVKHDSLIFPPDLPHGDATVLRDEPNPRFELSSSSTAARPQIDNRASTSQRPLGGRVKEFTSVPADVVPEQEPKQLRLGKSGRPEGLTIAGRATLPPPPAAPTLPVQIGHGPGPRGLDVPPIEAPPAQHPLIGKTVQWVSQGAEQFSEPRKVTSVAEHNGKQFAMVEGSNTGIPVDELEIQKPAKSGGDIFPNDRAMEDWLNNQYERSPRIQRIKDLVRQRIEQGNLPPGIRPSDAELARTDQRISGMIQEANAQGVDTPAQLDRIDQWIRATNKPPKPFQAGRPLKTRPAPTQESLAVPQQHPGNGTQGQRPESVVEGVLKKLDLSKLREAADAGNINYGQDDTKEDLIGKIMDAYAGQDEHLSNLAETLQGNRAKVPAGPREKAPADDTDYTDIMERSVKEANAKKAQKNTQATGPVTADELSSRQQAAIDDYLAEIGRDKWNPATSTFQPRKVSIAELEGAKNRPLYPSVKPSLAGLSRTSGPILVDSDMSVIDGMHRVADAIKAGETSIDALVRTERRQPGNASFRDTLKDMSPAEKDAALEAYHQRERTSAKTGLPNELAFTESAATLGQSHRHIGFADADDFKLLNDTFDHKYVDEKVLRPIGELMAAAAQRENGAVQPYHISGDEFTFRASDPAAITRVVNHVNAQMAGAKFEIKKPDGSIVTREGVGLSHGTGFTQAEAEAAASADKTARRLSGQRTGARDADREAAQNQNPTTGGTPQGKQNNQGDTSQRQGLLSPAASLRPGDAAMVPTADLHTDPARFQYKTTNIGEGGVTSALKEQTKYDQNKGGVLLVWRDPANGRVFIVNGHHRFELAQRAGEPAVLARMIDAPDAETAKVIGAETNISEGHGSIVDAARYFKAARIATVADAAKRNLPMGQAKVTDGLAMARLDNSILDRVESGDIPEGRAVAIGKITDSPAQQDATLQAIAKREARTTKPVTNGEAESIARQVRDADSHIQQGQDLFGAFNREQSLFGEQAEIDDFISRQLRNDKRTFGAVSTKGRAEVLGKVEGQQINPEENKRISEQAAQADELYKRLVNRPGPIHDIRKEAAKELTNRYSKPNAVKAKAYDRIRQELQGQLGSMSATGTEGKRP